MNVYLDYAATTPLDGEVLEKMLPFLKENFGNPDSLHTFGRAAAYAVSEARDRVAETLGVRPAEVYFTAGGTEADNWAVRGLGKGKALVSAIEHQAVLSAAALREGGAEFLPVTEEGTADLRAAERMLAPETGLVCVMAVNNETGCLQPVERLGELCRPRGALLFSDCVQAAGTCDLKELARSVDALSLSAHKIYGPKGAGALVVKKGVPLKPLVAGGGEQRVYRFDNMKVACSGG